MEFLQLKYFQHAAKTENFSHTAAAFSVPPSCVSASVKKLERELGVTLFDRTANTLSLNGNGKRFLKTAETVFSEIERARSELSESAGAPGGKIRMRINASRHIITKIIADFRAQYPQVSFLLDFGGSRDDSDYAIVVSDEVIGGEFERHEFLKEEIMLAVHKTHPIAARKEIGAAMLSGEKFICLHPKYSLRKLTESICAEAGFRPDIVLECGDPQCITDYLKMGMGVSLFPTVSWQNELDPSLVLVRLNGGVYRRTNVYLNKNAPPSAKIFLRHMQGYKTERAAP